MWFYFGIFTAAITLTIRLYQKLQIKSVLQIRQYTRKLSTEKEPAQSYLQIPCRTGLQFSARFEKNSDKWAKTIGISHEVQTKNRLFDEKIYLASITESDAELLGKDDKTLQLISKLLSDI